MIEISDTWQIMVQDRTGPLGIREIWLLQACSCQTDISEVDASRCNNVVHVIIAYVMQCQRSELTPSRRDACKKYWKITYKSTLKDGPIIAHLRNEKMYICDMV